MSHTPKSVTGNPVSLVWLRRDLRLHDHAVLAAAARHAEPVQPVFVFDTDILARFTNKDDRRLTLIVRALCRMHQQLSEQGGGILAFHGKAADLLPRICVTLPVARLIAAGDVEPGTRARDEQVKAKLEGRTPFTLVKDHVLHAAHEVLKGDGTPYKVFTPYSKAWREKAKETRCMEERSVKGVRYAGMAVHQISLKAAGFPVIDLSRGVEAVLAAIGYRVADSEWKPEKAHARLEEFLERSANGYKERRDLPAVDGTSRLSPYLRFGIVSARECARAAAELEAQGSIGGSTWLNELIWRDFFSMILAHFPESATQEFQQQYRGLRWRYDKADFARWAEGMTGYPIVDAAMRELLQTGIMHNRARMIVASFMTKDLLLDWRMGEEHFAQHLMDYDLASNVGGWQWAASTGTDAQPYFRIFNPSLQSKRFDPQGEYIRRFVPELAHLPASDIHEPWKKARPAGYPAPIVDHADVKTKVLNLFKLPQTP